MGLSLRSRLVVLMVAAIVPLFALSLGKTWLNQQAAVSRASDELKFAASLVAASQSRMVDSAHQILVAIANAPGLLGANSADCPRYLQTLKRQLGTYANLGLISLDGYLICHAMGEGTNIYLGDRSYVQETLQQRRFTVGGYTLGRVVGKPVITFSMPVMNGQGQAMALAYASVDLDELARPLLALALPQGARVTIFDRQGLVLAAHPPNSNVIGQPMPSPALQDAIKAMRPGSAQGLDSLGRQRIYSFLPAGQKQGDTALLVAVSADRDAVLAPVRQQLMLELMVLALVAFSGSWLAWRMGGRAIVAPAMALLEATRQAQQGRLDVRIPLDARGGEDEFSRIAAGFNQMAESLQQQRQALQAELANSQAMQEKLSDAQRVGCLGYWRQDLASGQVWCSDEVHELLGVDRASFDCSAACFTQLIHPLDRGAYQGERDAAMAAGLPLDAQFRIITPAGQVRWMHQFGRSHLGSDDQPSSHRSGVIQDITQRKQAEQALIDSEQRYAALFEAAPVPMWVYDMESAKFLTVNRAALENYGYTAQEFQAMTLFDIRPETEHRRLRQQLVERKWRHRKLWRHQRKDGSVFPVDAVSQPIQYAGRAARFVVALDMSAQVKAEHEVQEYLFTLQRAADAAQVITWHQTLEGTMQEVVDQARGVIGTHQAVLCLSDEQAPDAHALSLSEKYAAYKDLKEPLQGSGIYALVCQAERALRLTQAEIEAHLQWGGAPGQAQAGLPLRGWLSVPLNGHHGKTIGVLQLSDKYQGEFTQQDEYVAIELAHLASAAIENTRLLEQVSRLNAGLEQKVAERTAELARQEALFRALAEQAPQMVWTASPEGAATYYNRAWFELMGGALKDWSGYQWLDAVHPEDVVQIKANWKKARETLRPYSGTRRLLARDGAYHTMAYRASAVLGENGQVAFWVGIDADITEIKAIEAALRLSNQELEAFSYSVSHDLRAPLNTVDGFSRLLAKQLAGAADEKVLHYLSRIHAGVAQMGRLIEDLLSLSQLTRAQLRCEPLDLSAAARSILAEWQSRQPERQVAVAVQADLSAEGDGRLVRVALENLLANAWKFTSQQASAEIEVGQMLDAAGLPVFFVRDNGAGFNMAYADKLFTAFQRLHAASEFPGTGVGLAIVSRVIERHGGRLWAESAPGCGATFFFTLPRLRLLA
jgi:PAS domain S-box-containing protein